MPIEKRWLQSSRITFFQLAIEHSRHGQSRFVVQIAAVYEVSEAMEFAQSKLDKSVCYKQGAGL